MDIAIRQYIHIVDDKPATSFKETACMEHCSTGLEQLRSLITYLKEHLA